MSTTIKFTANGAAKFRTLSMQITLLAALIFTTTAYCSSSTSSSELPSSLPTQRIVMRNDHPITVWSRVPHHPLHAILLIHGRTWSALPNFDLQLSNESAKARQEKSIMHRLSRAEYAVYAIDLRGYGKTPPNADRWNTPLQAAGDVAEVLRWIARRHPSLDKPALLGWSMGSLVAHLTAQLHGELLSDLILYGYPRDPAATSTTASASAAVTSEAAPYEVNTVANAKSDFISPNAISQTTIDVYVKAALKADPIRAEWHRLQEYRVLDAALIKNPTLLMQGERDPLAPIAAQSRVFVALGNADKQWVILPGGDHAALIENTQPAFVASIRAFIERPNPRRDN